LHPLEGMVSVENTTTPHLPVETMHKPAKDHRLSSKASKGSALVAINKCVFFLCVKHYLCSNNMEVPTNWIHVSMLVKTHQ
jgi:hypothetical protein